MGHFYYYIPGVMGPSATLQKLEDLGLAYAFDVADYAPRGVSRGPDRDQGVVVSYSRKCGYYPERQTWQKMHGLDVWLGWDNDDKPGPKDLARADSLAGHAVELGDGQEWVAPVARSIDGSTYLPRKRNYKDGKWVAEKVIDKYKSIWDIACKFWDSFVLPEIEKQCDELDKKKILSLTFDEETDFALAALSQNYRVGPEEVSALGLFNDASISEILCALIDWPRVLELDKKKEEEAQEA